ncbi:MAG: S-layer protein domain-containing protein [Methanosarcinaceae archaeon]
MIIKSKTVTRGIIFILILITAGTTAVEAIEVRGPVYEGVSLQEIIGINNDDYIEMNAGNFAGFFYDVDKNISSETLRIYGGDFLPDARTITENGIVYTCKVASTGYKYEGDWKGQEYPVIGFFGEKYIPLRSAEKEIWECNPEKIAKLILDDDQKYTLRAGDTLDLGEGYALNVKQFDVDREKVWLEFTKDGEYVDDEIISVTAETPDELKTWAVELDNIEGEDDVIVMRVHVNQIFHDVVGGIVQIEGIWLIDYYNAFTIELGDNFGKLDVVEMKDGSGPNDPGYLMFRNKKPVFLQKGDSRKGLMDKLSFEVADDENLRFYLKKEFTEPGIYETRGSIARANDPEFEWDYSTFAGFFYYLDEDISSESLTINASTLMGNDRTIDAGELTYFANITTVNYEYTDDDNWTEKYETIGLFENEFVVLRSQDEMDWEARPDKLAKLVLDSGEKYTIRPGQTLDLGNGYNLKAKEVYLENDSVWLEFIKDREPVDDKIIEININDTWEVELDDIEDKDNITVLRVHVNQVFQGAVDRIAQLEGIWLIDYENAFTIELEDSYGRLKVVEIGGGSGPDDTGDLIFKNYKPVFLERGSVQDLGDNLKFRVFDEPELKFYPFAEWRIMGESPQEETQIHVCRDGTADYTTIQEAVDNAVEGDMIVVHPGTYIENINVDKELAIISRSGYPGDTVVQVASPNSHVFHVSSDRVKISGFSITGATQGIPNNAVAGIYLDGASKNTIQNNEIVNNEIGIILSDFSNENLLQRNTVQNSDTGILLEGGAYNTLIRNDASYNTAGIYIINSSLNQFFQNTISENSFGITLLNSDKNYLRENRISLNRNGIMLENSKRNSIYNNRFNNTNNVELEGNNNANFWNTSKASYANTLGGPYLGGNFWAKPDGNGFSQIYPVDENEDLISDLSYNIGEYNTDYFPLLLPYFNRSTSKAVGDEAEGPYIWNYSNCDLFFCDPDTGIYTENLSVNAVESRTIGEGKLVYKTQAGYVKYRYQEKDWKGETYPIIGFFGEPYIPLTDKYEIVRVNKLAKLLVDDAEKHTLRTGEILDLGDGYTLESRMVDAEKNKVWLIFLREGKYVADEIIDLSEGNENGETWEVNLEDVEGEDGVLVLRVHINQILREEEGEEDMVQIQGLWLIDYDNAFEIKFDDGFGMLEVTEIRCGNGPDDPGYFMLKNNEPVYLDRNSVQDIAVGMKFDVMDSPELKYHLFIEAKETKIENALSCYPFYPFNSEITSKEGETQEFNVTCNKISNITLYLNGKEVKNETSATFLSYESSTVPAGTYQVRATAITEAEEVQRNWRWIVGKEGTNNEDSSGSGSSSGGGGGAGTPESARNIEIKELSQQFVTNGKHVKFEFLQEVTCVNCVEFDAMRTVGRTTTIVEMLKEKSTLTESAPEGEIYRYLNIWVGNSGFASPENIAEPCVGFKVEKAWIAENGIEETTICLCRYSEGKWDRLPTEKVGEDQNYLYFKASTPGFSPFAITVEKKTRTTEATNDENPVASDTEAENKTTKNEKIPGIGVIPAYLIFILAERVTGKKR